MPPGKPRGYAFIEFEHKNDMKNAYKMADGRKVENKRVTVDVERGRTVPNWYVLPASLLVPAAPHLRAGTCLYVPMSNHFNPHMCTTRCGWGCAAMSQCMLQG